MDSSDMSLSSLPEWSDEMSVGNFLIMEFPATGKTAKAADAFLMKRGIILRAVAAYGLPNCLRISVGTEDANKAAIAALEEFVK